MLTTLIDWAGRLMTLEQLALLVGSSVNTLHEPLHELERNRLEQAKVSYVSQGYSEQKAKVYALYELGYIENNPETVCRNNGIN